jgi:hypothetical protein
MLSTTLKRSFAVLAVAGGMLVAAGPAGAAIIYNGHAGLGSSAYQHNQTDLEYVAIQDGTSNTVFFGIAADGRGADYAASYVAAPGT